MKMIVVAAIIASSMMVMQPTWAETEVSVGIVVGNAPPPLPYEEVPSPRYGYVWVPGYWDWDGREYMWQEGYWLLDRAGYVYETPFWYFGSGGWYRRPGGWHHHRHQPHDRTDHGRNDWSYDWQRRQPRYQTGQSGRQDHSGNRHHDRHQQIDRLHGRDHKDKHERKYEHQPKPAGDSVKSASPPSQHRNGRDPSDKKSGGRDRSQGHNPSAWGPR